ncbi:MAG: hypothetical protein KC620_09545 [Myxococcales bacterium]|nr:hypothetical protein [Myxococcales bacterium]
MADEEIEGDDREERMEALLATLGVPGGLAMMQVYSASVTHAGNVTVDPGSRPWIPTGARSIGGRVRALVQHPKDARILYAGTAFGGVFRTTDGGDTWAPIGAADAAYPVGALAIAPSNPNILYIGSGEQFPQIVLNPPQGPPGLGIFRYDAAANSLTNEVGPQPASPPVPAGASAGYGAIAVDPHDEHRCWFAADTGLWRRERAANGTVSFTQDLPPALIGQVTDVVIAENFDPAHPRHLRLYIGIQGRGVYAAVCTGAGALTWQGRLNTSAATGTMSRVRLALCHRRPQRVYALLETAARNGYLPLEVTDDAGVNWTPRALPAAPVLGTYPWWCTFIGAHPDHPDIVVVGGVEVLRSLDAGVNWTHVVDTRLYDQGDYAQHADQHVGFFDRAEPNAFWLTNDGGVARATDMINQNPATSGGWRKRSHGLLIGQFNDITVHPTFPEIMGGGLQDNGTWLGFGGPTWYSIGGGDGGQLALRVNDARTFFPTTQTRVDRAIVGAPTSTYPTPGFYPLLQRGMLNADRAGTQRAFSMVLNVTANMAGSLPPFVGLVRGHPVTQDHMLAGRQGGVGATGNAYWTNNGGVGWTSMGLPGFVAGNAQAVTVVAYGVGASGASADWWIGTSTGRVIVGTGATEATKAYAVVTPPHPPGTNPRIGAIVPHPGTRDYVVVVTAGDAGNNVSQGRVWLTRNRGTSWVDLTVDVAASPVNSLPPSPFIAAAFDPQPAVGDPQVLFVGTTVGVYVARNLPRRNAPAAAVAPVIWNNFNNRAGSGVPAVRGKLPLTFITDLELRGTRLYAATHGRGIYECELATAGGIPQYRLYLRQTVIESGLTYPRPTPAVLNGAAAGQWNGDPRFPAGTVQMNDTDGYDLRVDNAPFQFLDAVIDGVEFDTSLAHKSVAGGRKNAVYVQVHTRGWDGLTGANAARVHLFFATHPAPANANAAPGPNLQAGFWAAATNDGTSPAAPAGPWQRIDVARSLTTVGPGQPAVARFEWQAPPTIAAGQQIALLAVVTSAGDPIGVPALDLPTLIRNERRAIYRQVPLTPFQPQVYLRDGTDDAGDLGSVLAAGRSPDIIVRNAAEANPANAFADLLDRRDADRLTGGVVNHVYVRVFNTTTQPTNVDVDLYWARTNAPISDPDAHAPPFEAGKIVAAVPLGTVTNVAIPAEGWAVAAFQWTPDAPPDHPTPAYKDALVIALVRSHDALDPGPVPGPHHRRGELLALLPHPRRRRQRRHARRALQLTAARPVGDLRTPPCGRPPHRRGLRPTMPRPAPDLLTPPRRRPHLRPFPERQCGVMLTIFGLRFNRFEAIAAIFCALVALACSGPAPQPRPEPEPMPPTAPKTAAPTPLDAHAGRLTARPAPGGVTNAGETRLYLDAPGAVFAIDLPGGALRWAGPPGVPLLAEAQRVLVLEDDGALTALAAADGRPRGRTPPLPFPYARGVVEALEWTQDGALQARWMAELPAAGPREAVSQQGLARWTPSDAAWTPVTSPEEVPRPSLLEAGDAPFALAEEALPEGWRHADWTFQIVRRHDEVLARRAHAGKARPARKLATLEAAPATLRVYRTLDEAHALAVRCPAPGEPCTWALFNLTDDRAPTEGPGGEHLAGRPAVRGGVLPWPVGAISGDPEALQGFALPGGDLRFTHPLRRPALAAPAP